MAASLPRPVRFAAATAAVLAACLAPASALPSGPGFFDVPGLDKAVHAGLFFLWTAALARDFPGAFGGSGFRAAAMPVAAAALFGLGTEALQLLSPGRSFDLSDLAADAAGAAAFVAFRAARAGRALRGGPGGSRARRTSAGT